MKKIRYTLILGFCVLGTLWAQPGFDDNVNDEPAAPINGYVWCLVVAAIVLVSLALRKRSTA
ncbi:MAG: hypothetical protein RQ756_01135 [Flavobacteriaceae bacterium]|nr:hypothetical protein [Flavobacteriaceae bacterium]